MAVSHLFGMHSSATNFDKIFYILTGNIRFSGSSLRRFGQSIKRIVREVEEQNSGKDQQLKFLELF